MIDAVPRLMVEDVEAATTLEVVKLQSGAFSLTIYAQLGGSDNWAAKGEIDVDAAALAAIASFTGAVPSDATLLALPCEEQHRLAKLLAENVGYVLAEEPEHPDSPHRAAPGRPAIEAKAPEFDSEGIPYAAADDPRIEPLKVAIEGECDGLMIANESARTILGQMDHEMILSGAVTAERFFLATDNDSHWYLVPVAKAAEWEAWLALPEDDERAWDAPDFAKPLGGAPGLVTFVDPQQGCTSAPKAREG